LTTLPLHFRQNGMNPPTYSQFVALVEQHAPSSGAKLIIDQDTLVVIRADGSATSLSLDRLFRAFVQSFEQDAKLSSSDRVNTVLAASDKWMTQAGQKSIFSLETLNLQSPIVMMQKCVVFRKD